MDTKALQLASRFSLAPNSLGYCGKNTATQRFITCIQSGHCQLVEDELRKFIVLHPYYKTIAKIAKQPLFSYKVIESYWIGNDLLTKAKPEHYDILLEAFQTQGVPEWFVAELRQNRPSFFIPNHLFQVLYIGVGKASGAVPFNISSINNCMVRWGYVKEINRSHLTVLLNSLKKRGRRYELVKKRTRLKIDTKIIDQIKLGDCVGVHWQMVVKKLNKAEENKLEFWTKKICSSLG